MGPTHTLGHRQSDPLSPGSLRTVAGLGALRLLNVPKLSQEVVHGVQGKVPVQEALGLVCKDGQVDRLALFEEGCKVSCHELFRTLAQLRVLVADPILHVRADGSVEACESVLKPRQGPEEGPPRLSARPRLMFGCGPLYAGRQGARTRSVDRRVCEPGDRGFSLTDKLMIE